MNAHKQNGFTLVEIMIAVVLIGLLASIAIPAFATVRERAQNSRLANDLRVFAGQMETFSLEQGAFPEDSNSGQIPSGFAEYIKPEQWFDGPSIGGVFDVEKDAYGLRSAVGVHRYTVSEEQLLAFDRAHDDGNLASGLYRKIASHRYYYVVAE